MIQAKPRARAGLSEIMAAVITVVITIIAGAALYGFINGQAATQENGLGVANAANVNFLNERFVVVDMAYGTNTAYIYLYNNGNVTLNLKEIVLHNANDSVYAVFNSTVTDRTPTQTSCGSPADPSAGSANFAFGPGGTSINIGSTKELILTGPSNGSSNCIVPGTSGTTYYAIAVGVFGSKQVYYQCDPANAQQQECAE